MSYTLHHQQKFNPKCNKYIFNLVILSKNLSIKSETTIPVSTNKYKTSLTDLMITNYFTKHYCAT